MKTLALLLILLVLANPAIADTSSTHYSFISPSIGNTTNWGLSLNSNFATLDADLWNTACGLTNGVNSQSSATNITLSNPLNNFQSITFTAGSQFLILPAMNATSSLVTGCGITVYNAGSNTFGIKAQDGSTVVYSSLVAGQSVRLRLTSGATANGSFLAESTASNLGTSVTAASPSVSGDLTTGFYTAGAGKVDVAVSGSKVAEFSSSGLNGSAIGATTSSTGNFTTLSTPSATITGGTINGTTLGATTSAAGKFSTLAAGTNSYPTNNGTNGQFLQTNGSGTASWATASSIMQILGGTGGNTIPQGSTYYMMYGSSTGVATMNTPVSVSGTLKNLQVLCFSPLPPSETATVTLFKNGSSTPMTCTITGPLGACNDGTHTVSVAAGDGIDLQVITSASSGSSSYQFSLQEMVP